MFKKALILIIVGIIAGAVYLNWSASKDMTLELVAAVQSNGLYVLAFAAILVTLLCVVVFYTRLHARKRKRDLDEYMRVAQQTSTQSQNIADSKPATQEISTETKLQDFPLLSVIDGGKIKAKRQTLKKPTKLTKELYFQPISDVSDGRVIGYDVYRKTVQSPASNPVFVQEGRDPSKSSRAAFEFSILEQAASASRHPAWASQVEDLRFFVHISDAILDDKTLWKEVFSLLKAHKTVASLIVPCVNSTAFNNADAKTIDLRMKKIRKLATIGVEVGLYGFDHDAQILTAHQIESFLLIMCEKDDLLRVQSGDKEQNSIDAFHQVRKSAVGIVARGIVCDADIVDCLSYGINLMSGDFLSPPKKLKSGNIAQDNSPEQNNHG